jgi:Flp pilus assembly protein TadD
VLVSAAAAQDREQTIALVLDPGGALVYRSGDSLGIPAVAGDALFAGDKLTAGASPASVLRCGANAGHRFRLVGGSIVFRTDTDDESEATVQGRMPVTPCLLPALERRPAVAALDSMEGRWAAATADGDMPTRVARAVAQERAGNAEQAAAEYAAIAERWPEQKWARRLVYTVGAKTSQQPGAGKLYALLLGISKYQGQAIRPLRFAHADAELVGNFLKTTERGRALGGGAEMEILTDVEARYGTVRTVMNEFFARAGSEDSVLLFIAAHGIAYNEDGYVILHDSNVQSLYTTAISMSEIRNTLAAHAPRVKRVYLFVDACHADRIGPIRNFAKVNEQLRAAVGSVKQGRIFAFFAASGDEEAFEHPRYGGGHGAFTYFLMRALNIRKDYSDYTAADFDRDGFLTPTEVIEYVSDRVRVSTNRKQRPQGDTRAVDLKVPVSAAPLQLPCCNPLDKGDVGMTGASRDPTKPVEAEEGRGIPGLDRRIALENEIHELLLKYLEGDEIPQRREDFARGAQAAAEAGKLWGSSVFHEAREEFFRGRALIFDKNYAAAADRLHRSIRLDPASPYAYNALGIAYLEQAQYELARAAFLDAIRRAPYWAYPRHNLALVNTQTGEYAQAIATYREAMRLVPQYSYLPYNLGLVYQRMNRDDEAEQSYKMAHEKAPWRATPSIALGVLMTDRGRESAARRYFAEAREILAKRPDPDVLPTLRHNEALLLARRRSSLDDARRLWRENIESANYLPSRFALAQALTRAAAKDEALLSDAVRAWREVLEHTPDHRSARAQLANLEARMAKQ